MKLLMLVQTESDVAHLDGAAKAILTSSIAGVWVVFSPAITVNAAEAATKLESEIDQLRQAERQAAQREDYTAAAGYKTQREGKELDRAKALRDAWKTAPQEARTKKTQEIFAPLIAQLKPNGINVKISGHSDHYDREQWVAMLNSLSGVWFKEFTPGSFMVTWPEAVSASVKAAQEIAPLPAEPFPYGAGNAVGSESYNKTRGDELAALRHFGLVAEAKKAGVDPKGKSKAAIIADILAAEQKPAAPEPALAEY